MMQTIVLCKSYAKEVINSLLSFIAFGKVSKFVLRSFFAIAFFISVSEGIFAQEISASSSQNMEESFEQSKDAFDAWSDLCSEMFFRDAGLPTVSFGLRLTSVYGNPTIVFDLIKNNSNSLICLQTPHSGLMYHKVSISRYQSHYYIYSLRKIRI